MTKELQITKNWDNNIYKNQTNQQTVDGEFKPFFIAVLVEYEIEIEARGWFKGKADRVVYRRRWE